jgi:hypothetical protein
MSDRARRRRSRIAEPSANPDWRAPLNFFLYSPLHFCRRHTTTTTTGSESKRIAIPKKLHSREDEQTIDRSIRNAPGPSATDDDDDTGRRQK